MLFQDTDPTPPVLPVEVRAQAIPRVGGPWASREGAGASLRHPWESQIIYLGLVYCMYDRQPNPVYCGLSPVHTVVVCYHVPRCGLNSTLRAWYLPSDSHSL